MLRVQKNLFGVQIEYRSIVLHHNFTENAFLQAFKLPNHPQNLSNNKFRLHKVNPMTRSPATPVAEPEKEQTEEEKKEAEKLKPRHPPAYITPEEYSSATLSALTPEIIGPSTAVSFPHLLGFRNTPIRIYRFLNRRVLADNVGRQVASAILASHRPYSTVSSTDDASASTGGSVSEVTTVSQHEERDWWKTTYRERESHEESVWIEPCIVDERLTARMSRFELGVEEEARAKRIGEGKEKAITKYLPEQE